MAESLQYLRRVRLTVSGAGSVMDLSQMRIHFKVRQFDSESPNNAEIRIYNLSRSKIDQIIEEFREVTLEAGYQFNLGVIFKGTVKWVRVGREPNNVDTYLDLLCADGDIPYNQAFIAKSVMAGATAKDRIDEITKSMQEKGLGASPTVVMKETTGGILPRGKVLFSMAKVAMRKEAEALASSWSIQNGELVLLPNDEFIPGEAIVLTGHSGLIGRPEQTLDGIRAKCLINPKIKIGQLVKLDNASINQQVSVDNPANVAYDSYSNLQFLANLSTDGLYRVYVCEYEGDTRAVPWYCDLTLLAVDPKENLVIIE